MNERKLNSFRKKFKEELKKDELDIRIYKEKNKIIIKQRSWRSLVSEYEQIGDSLRRTYLKWSSINEELIEKTQEYWEGYAKVSDLGFIVFDDLSYKYDVFNCVEKLGYKKMTEFATSEEIMKTFHYLSNNTYIKEIIPGIIKKYIELNEQIGSFLNEYKVKDPTFSYNSADEFVKFGKISFYLKGYKGSIQIERLEDEFVVKEQTLKVKQTFKEPSTIVKTFKEIFTIVEKRQRTKNIFEPPKKFFKSFMISRMVIHNEEYQNRIYSLLRGIYDPNTIEDLCAEAIKSSEIPKGMKISTVYMNEVFDYIVVVDKNNEKIFKKNEKESAKCFYETLVKKELKRKLEEDTETLIKQLEEY